MPGAGVYWTLVFTAASAEHLAERNIEAVDVVAAVYGRHGPARVRRTGRGVGLRLFVMAPLDTGELLTCVLRVASPRDLSAEGAFVISSEGLPEGPGRFDSSMRLCVSARVAMEDEVRSYRRWRASKGER
jgi:hypothetical protein